VCRVKKALPWILLGAAVAIIGILLFQPSSSLGFKKVDSAGLLALQAKGAQIIDVRTAGEFALAHIPGAVNVPVDQLHASAASWNRSANYVVYCASGVRSAQASDIMKAMGFRNVADLSGGIATWTGQTVKGAATAQQTIPTSGKPVFIEFYTPT
jgi:rhodanese-related sulfurtransferase